MTFQLPSEQEALPLWGGLLHWQPALKADTGLVCAEAVIHLGAMHRDSLRSGLPAPWGLAASEGCPTVSCSGV